MANISRFMTHVSRTSMAEQIQSAIDTATAQDASADFVAGLETALDIISNPVDAQLEETRNA